MTDDGLVLRLGTDEDFPAVFDLVDQAFGGQTPEDRLAVERLVFEGDRSHVVTDGERIVGNVAAYSRDVTVPGAVLPAAHVTLVAVAPTYRRRGLLTRMIRAQLADVAARGEPIATLWASEGAIYQRFGYGLAVPRLAFEIQSRQVRLTPPDGGTGEIVDADPAAVRTGLREVYERQRPLRPGLSSRSDPWWEARLADPESYRKGTTKRRAALYRTPDRVDGYALWRVRSEWDANGPKGAVLVDELVADTPAAYAALWRFLLSIDLTRRVEYGFGTVDEPLQYLVDEPRRLGGRAGDALWLRIVDLPAALAARRYAAGVDVVLEVTDGLLPANAGRWRLRAGTGEVLCEPSDRPADLSMDITALGAAYLGGTGLGALAAAGRVRATRPDILAAASAAFGWHRAPAAIEVF